ncbi:MAG: DUF6029 family protein [Salinivirgaceae bacterium]
MKVLNKLLFRYKIASTVLMLIISGFSAWAQVDFKGGNITGNFKLDAQTYREDSTIGAEKVAEKMLSNSYMNLIYTNGNFTAGVRFEGYFNTMLGYDNNYDGFGIANRYATYAGEMFEVTVGNFYDQFGNGLIFRTYEDKDLGYDNSMDGARIKFRPLPGIILKGVIGNQRLYWEKGEGIVRGVDGEFALNDLFSSLAASDNRITLSGSFVNKYQADENPIYILPENVGAGAGMLNFSRGNFSLATEYAYKSQDPSADNNLIYKSGSAFLINSDYSVNGLGIMLQYKWVDNMSFRSERDAQLNNLMINYLPAITKNHAYALTAMYPYATQVDGEAGIQGEVFYKFKKETVLGGTYGTNITLNYARIQDIKRNPIDSSTPIGQTGTDGYTTSFLSMSDSLLNQDINFEITKKISEKYKVVFVYQHLDFNQLALQGHGKEYNGMVNSNTFVADVYWRIKPKHTLRIESEALFTKAVDFTTQQNEVVKIKQDFGNWVMLMLEYSVSPHWFFAVSDQFNYVSTNKKTAENTFEYLHRQYPFNRNHFFSMAMGYSKGASRIQVSYGKQREGILCVGGVCRPVPAAYGFNISVSSTF